MPRAALLVTADYLNKTIALHLNGYPSPRPEYTVPVGYPNPSSNEILTLVAYGQEEEYFQFSAVVNIGTRLTQPETLKGSLG